MELSQCPTQSRYFGRLSNGLLERIERQVKSKLALDHRILTYILTNLQAEVDNANTSPNGKRWMLIFSTYLIVCFLCSLKGNEVFLVEFGGLVQHINDEKGPYEEKPHVLIPLLGRFKNENGERWYMMLGGSEATSGFNPRMWVQLLVKRKISGMVFYNINGDKIPSTVMKKCFILEILKVKEQKPDLVLYDEDNI